MLHIVFNDADNVTVSNLIIYNRVSQDIVTPYLVDVVSLYATDEEANYIKQRFGTFTTIGGCWNMNIPWNHFKNEQTWYGDIAKTILANL